MSDWKMSRVISSIWGKLEEKNQKKALKYKNWCALLDKKSSTILYTLKALEATDTDKKEKLTLVTNKVIVSVNELITTLAVDAYKNDTCFGSASASLQDSIRDSLLDVWAPLLSVIPKLEQIDATAVVQVHKAVLLLMCRDEFSCDSFEQTLARESSHNKEILIKYRRMLQTTLQIATQKLVEKPSSPATLSATFNIAMNSMMNINFAGKVLAVLYWRLPYVGATISQILEIPNMELLAPVLSFPAFPDAQMDTAFGSESGERSNQSGPSHSTNSDHSINNSTTNNSESNNIPKPKRGSSLFGWAKLYKDLPPLSGSFLALPTSPIPTPSQQSSSTTSSPSSPSSSPASPPKSPPTLPASSSTSAITTAPSLSMSVSLPPNAPPWLSVLAKFEVAYITFFKEWILHVRNVLGKVQWSAVPGFPRLLQSLLYQMRTKDQPPPPLSKPYPLLELQYILLDQTNAELIDSFIKAAFLRTNVFDLLAVLNTLHLVEGWFSELNAHHFNLPATFDMPFFCSGLAILLQSDHHQTVLRVITFIYTYSELFEDLHRAILFDIFLTKNFYTLFMHWDPGVRNAYHQLLIFKMVRIKRSTLYNDGYVVKELSQVNTTSYNSKDASPDSSASSLSSLVSSRSGSGFFSSFSNVLPAFFSLSNSPDKDATTSPDKDISSTPPTVSSLETTPPQITADTNANGGHAKDQTKPNSVSQEPVATTGKTPLSPPSNTIKMGNERVNFNGSSGAASKNDALDEGFIELAPTSSSTSTTSDATTTSPTGEQATMPAEPPSASTSTSSTSASIPSTASIPTPATPTTVTPTPTIASTAAPTSPTLSTSTPNTNLEASPNIDVQLFLQLNSYLKTIEDQLRKPTAKKVFPSRLESYAPYALAEFNQHLARYHQWELKNEDPPRIMSLPFARMGEG